MRARMLVVACIASSARLASAETTPLSQLSTEIRTERATRAPADLRLAVEHAYATIAPTYCHLELDAVRWANGDADLDEDRRSSWLELKGDAASSPNPFGVERLVVRGADAELERTALAATRDGLVVTATARIHIALHRVASIDARHDVYAYTVGDHVFVIAPARGAAGARFDSAEPFSGRGVTRQQDCGYAITQLRVDRSGSSQAVQLSGTLDAAYVVDASVSKTRRDAEPILSVTVRGVR